MHLNKRDICDECSLLQTVEQNELYQLNESFKSENTIDLNCKDVVM